MLYAHKKFLVTVDSVESDGMLETVGGTIPVSKGEIVAHDQLGNPNVLTEEYFYENYVPVRKMRKATSRRTKLSPFEEQFAKGYVEMGELVKQSNENNDNYIFEPKKTF